jgi:hypothetical protein
MPNQILHPLYAGGDFSLQNEATAISSCPVKKAETKLAVAAMFLIFFLS